jgi:hypothetical protein
MRRVERQSAEGGRGEWRVGEGSGEGERGVEGGEVLVERPSRMTVNASIRIDSSAMYSLVSMN